MVDLRVGGSIILKWNYRNGFRLCDMIYVTKTKHSEFLTMTNEESVNVRTFLKVKLTLTPYFRP